MDGQLVAPSALRLRFATLRANGQAWRRVARTKQNGRSLRSARFGVYIEVATPYLRSAAVLSRAARNSDAASQFGQRSESARSRPRL